MGRRAPSVVPRPDGGRLGLAVSAAGEGLTPASLRGGGAVDLFHQTGDPHLVLWRCRWRQLRTMEHYLQEVTALSMLPSMSDNDRYRIQTFADACPQLLERFIDSLRTD